MSGDRLDAAGRAADARPAVAVGCVVTPCPVSCAEKWRAVEAETADTLQSDDPLERNRKISAAYAGMALRRPDMEWIGLASIVSRQAGCAMQYADEKAASWIPMVSSPAKVAKQALQETNKLIYSDIYPVMRFYERFGAASLKACRADRTGGAPVPREMLEAVNTLEQGDSRSASDQIAAYEQRSIVQTRVYNNPEYRKTFESNEFWAGNSVGRYFGARPAEIPLSPTCTVGNEIPFVGSIGNADDRVGYYKALVNSYAGQTSAWKNATLSSIASQGR